MDWGGKQYYSVYTKYQVTSIEAKTLGIYMQF